MDEFKKNAQKQLTAPLKTFVEIGKDFGITGTIDGIRFH